MPVLASQIIDRVRAQIIDPGPIYRWTDDELLKWLSDGQRTLVAAIPPSAGFVTTVNLALGTRQAIPADGFALLMVYRNVGGRACVPIERSLLDRQYPTWHNHTAEALVKFFAPDEVDPTAFFVYPPNNGFGSVEINYAKLPAELAALTDPITVDDMYQTPLVDYVCYRAHQKDSDFAAGAAAADQYFKSFAAFLEAQKVS